MRQRMRLLAAGMVCVLAASMAMAKNAVTRQVPVTEDFVESKIEWYTEVGVGYRFRWKALVIDGQFKICGVGAFHPSAVSQSRNVMRRVVAEHDGRIILRDMTYFARVPFGSDLVGQMANCAACGAQAPRRAWTVYLSWPPGRARF